MSIKATRGRLPHFAIAILYAFVGLLAIINCDDDDDGGGGGGAVSALSSPSPLNGYHFRATPDDEGPSKRRVTASDYLGGRRQGSTGGSYVPDGLTSEQYERIKSDELAKRRKMNFGMWGPRFALTDGDPDGNWFNLPSLWTGGFDANNGEDRNKVSSSSSRVVDGGRRRRRRGAILATYLRRYGPAYSMLLLSARLLVTSMLMLPAMKKAAASLSSTLFVKWVAVPAITLLLPLILLKPVGMLADFAAGRRLQVGWLDKNGMTKLAGAVSMLLMLVAFVLRM